MPTAPATKVEKITYTCTEPGCDFGPDGGPWQVRVVPRFKTQQLNMHKSRHHGYQSTNPATLRQAAMRTGEAAPLYTTNRRFAIQERIAETIRSNAYPPGSRLELAKVGREFDLGVNSVRQVFYHLARLTPPLVRQKDGAFYVMGEAEATERVRRRTGRPPAGTTLSEKIANQLRAALGSKYPVGSRLPTAWQLGAEFGVSDNSANRALKLLEGEGLVKTEGHSRYVITLPPKAEEAKHMPEQEPMPEAHVEEAGAPKHPTISDHIIEQIQDGTDRPSTRCT
jgi:DNA-binding GntR family transcriptional regulator